jgi:hypothetical protein
MSVPNTRVYLTGLRSATQGAGAAGTIPGYALDPNGTPHDALIFYKNLNQADESRAG